MPGIQSKQEGIQLIDTHCHIHDSEFSFKSNDVYSEAISTSVTKMICVGTSVKSSYEAVDYCAGRKGCYYSIAIHPHEAANLDMFELEGAWASLESLARSCLDDQKFVAIGECGLDYYYHHDSDILHKQQWLLHKHLALAASLKKPVIFHVRDAFSDFWPIYDEFKMPGVIHSFSSSHPDSLEMLLKRENLRVGLNGIMTFTKVDAQLESARRVPLEKLLLETDAPYLTPKPLRGTINTPANVRVVAEFLSDLRKEPIRLLADQTTTNAKQLFGF